MSKDRVLKRAQFPGNMVVWRKFCSWRILQRAAIFLIPMSSAILLSEFDVRWDRLPPCMRTQKAWRKTFLQLLVVQFVIHRWYRVIGSMLNAIHFSFRFLLIKTSLVDLKFEWTG